MSNTNGLKRGGWTKGMPSPNPGGRPKAATAFAKLALAATNDGKELLDLLLDVVRRKKEGLADDKSWRWAMSELLDRTLGRAPQYIEVATGEAPARVDYSVLSDEELEIFERLTAKLAAASIPDPAAGAPPPPNEDAGERNAPGSNGTVH